MKWAMIFVAGLSLLVALFLRPPGLDARDGRNDRGRNGISIGSDWITGNGSAGDFAASIREQRMAEVVIEFPPPNADGTLPGIDSARVEALLYECYDARGWVRVGVARQPFDDPRWRRFFIVDLRRLLDRLPRVRGVVLDFSRVPEVSPALLTLLDELRPVLAPDARPLAIVAHRWEQPYFREVARRADLLVIPLEIPASAFARFGVGKCVEQVHAALASCEGKPVLLRLPADRRLRRGLATVHLALGKTSARENFQGILLEVSAAPEAARWTELHTHFLRPETLR